MNGAESLVHTLLRSGVDTCFSNPGTSEMHFVAALDRVPGMRCVLGLFEGVVTGAADGYARMTGKPAATLLHCGPGLANGLANLHNARRAQTPIVNIVGDQATYHRPNDAPLTADTEGWARGASSWVRTATSSATVGADAAVAVQAARTHPGQIATLILPSDTSWDEGGIAADALPVPPRPQSDPAQIRNAAEILRRVSQIPSVEAASISTDVPLAGANAIFYAAEGQPPVDAHNRPRAFFHRVSPDFLRTLNTRLLNGRAFTEDEVRGNANVAVVTENMVKRFWPGQDPIGKRIKVGGLDSTRPWLSIVGVVSELKYRGVPKNPTRRPGFISSLQRTLARFLRAGTNIARPGEPDSIRSRSAPAGGAFDPDRRRKYDAGVRRP